jgi:hypothetical protein
MTRLPYAVARTYSPVGRLQLHDLRDKIRLHCAECGQDKTSGSVAVIGGDWDRMVCKSCFESLIRERQARKAEKKRQAQATKLRKAKTTEQAERLPPELPSASERRLLDQVPEAERLLAFFRAAGIQVEVGRRFLWIDGARTPLLNWIAPSTVELDWDRVIDEMAVKYVSEEFMKAVRKNARFSEHVDPLLQPHERGIAIMRHGLRLATIHATRAHIPQRAVICGNFLKPGRHWQQVADVLTALETADAGSDELIMNLQDRVNGPRKYRKRQANRLSPKNLKAERTCRKCGSKYTIEQGGTKTLCGTCFERQCKYDSPSVRAKPTAFESNRRRH